MSTKTLRKRIALVAVSALGAGLLSVVPVSSANAAPNVAAGTVQSAAATNGVLNIATLASVTGSAAATTTNTTNTSVGLINVRSLGDDLVAGTTQTAIMLSTGTLTVYSADTSAATAASSIVVTGGTISAASAPATTNATITAQQFLSSTGTSFTKVGDGTAAQTFGVSIKPNAGVTSMTVQLYTATSTTLTAAAANPTNGTLAGQIIVTIAASSASQVPAAAKSGVYYFNASTAPSSAATADTTDTAYGSTVPAGKVNYGTVTVRDAYSSGISSTAGLLQVSATNGALVKVAAASASIGQGTQSTDFLTGSSPNAAAFSVKAPTNTAPLTTVVTVTYNGTVIGTKSFTFTGPITKITLASPSKIGALSQAPTAAGGYKGAVVTFADSAGNVILPVAADSYYPTSGVLTGKSSDRGMVLSVVPTSTATGYVGWDCDAAASKEAAQIQYVNVNGLVAESNIITVACAGNAVTYKASYTAATYAPGEVATLKISFFDSKGNAANDTYAWAGTAPVITPGGGSLVTATTTSDTSSLGVATYSLTTIVTEGTYQTVVRVGTIQAANPAQKDEVAGFTLKSSSTGVSNADVLKAIVSLIASINKQIAALQKALLKK